MLNFFKKYFNGPNNLYFPCHVSGMEGGVIPSMGGLCLGEVGNSYVFAILSGA